MTNINLSFSKLEFKGYKTVCPVELVWRNALDVVKQLFSDPTFANHMTFHPHVTNINNQHEYRDYMSANMAWKIQDHLPLGVTQVLIILGSNKTPITRLARGIEMHPVFVTIGNIDSEVPWRCIAYIPIVKFCIHPDYQSILQARLWHKCMDLVCSNLKATAKDGCFMPDPFHNICHVFTLLVGHVCNLPEATMIAAVSKNASPLTMATQAVDPWDLDKFQKAAKAINLSGVHMPYWRNWMFACPSIFLTGEFFANHPLKWIKEAMGDYELNTRFMVQHKRVRTRHFTKGITHINQMTGRKHRDIQHTIVAPIAGAVPPRFVRAICALMDFFYLAQNLVYLPQSLELMVQALSDFHSFKDTIIQAEARRGKNGSKKDFFIPKLELLQSFDGTIKKLGTLMQAVADHTLKGHFPADVPANLKDFMEQCMRILNCQESMEMFGLYTLLTSHEDVTTTNPALSWSIHGPQPVHNHFLKGVLSGDALTAFQLNVAPDYKLLSLSDICTKYALLGFDLVLADFICCSSLSGGEHSHWDPRYGRFQAWHNDGFPLGNCDTVVIDAMGINGKMSSNLELPSYLSDPLLYIQFFHFISDPDDHPELAIWSVEHAYTQDENGNCHREGAVIQVTDMTHVVELIPVYGEAVAKGMSSTTCLESYKHFFLNNFTDKESYHTFSTEFV
ncbi:hypothetical protein BDR03DRAFT_930573 [Suillus americanus]|nr:hypothetical protein BDR03DRAFT_930573 [Suillus americanus]